jgi:hypothetical protein
MSTAPLVAAIAVCGDCLPPDSCRLLSAGLLEDQLHLVVGQGPIPDHEYVEKRRADRLGGSLSLDFECDEDGCRQLLGIGPECG